jgi:hypothetical protein
MRLTSYFRRINGLIVHPSVISLHGNYKELESCDLRAYAHRMRAVALTRKPGV